MIIISRGINFFPYLDVVKGLLTGIMSITHCLTYSHHLSLKNKESIWSYMDERAASIAMDSFPLVVND